MDQAAAPKPKTSLLVQLLRYGVVGGVAFAVDFGTLALLTKAFGLHYLVAAAFSFVLGLATNYLLSVKWVFDKRSIENPALEFAIFGLIGGAGLLANEVIMWGATEKAHVPYLFSKIIATVFVFVWNFGVRKVLLFDGGETAAQLFAEAKHPSERTYRYLTGGVLLVILVRLILSVASNAGSDWDFVNFYNAATRTLHHHITDLYANGRDGADPEQQYVGFPLTAYLFAPLGAFASRLALFVFKALCALCMGTGLTLLYRMCVAPLEAGRPRARFLFWFVLSVAFLEPFWFVFVIGGQATAVGFLLLVLFARAYLNDELWVAAAWLTPAVLIKPFLVLMIPILVCGGQYRLIRNLAVCGLAAGLLSVAIVGFPLHLDWVHIVLQESSARWSSRWWNNIAPLGIAANFWSYLIFDAPHFEVAEAPAAFITIKHVYQATLFATFMWLAYATGRQTIGVIAARTRLLLLALTFAISFAVIVWPHYMQFLFVPLALVFAQPLELPRRGHLLALAILLLSLHLELTTQFVAGIPWHRPHTLPGVLFTSMLGGGAIVVLQVLLVAYRKQLLFTAPRS